METVFDFFYQQKSFETFKQITEKARWELFCWINWERDVVIELLQPNFSLTWKLKDN